ncbi:sensor histidine kinase [Paenibacillus doosanensis]|uniref:sensor histidine kinase n=1 Tax=Paenibacillus doosanensis TaxID=1229154 RepID=UPI00217FAB6A|nr:sensor histidine kinase [Paenibacillus doosanensis]MCS7463768.1 sensor histidine kinase [Paenibacillus doosanensis]
MNGFKMRPFGKGMGVFQLIWLVYLTSPIYSILQKPTHDKWIGLALLLLFIVANCLCYWDEKRRMVYVLTMLAIIVFFCFHYHINFWFMSFYVAPVIGLMASVRQFYAGVVILLALFALVFGTHIHQFSGDDLVVLLPSSALMLVFPFIIRAGVRSKELRNQLNSANEEIARLIKNEERQRISRDLHDTLGHTLSLITLKSELAEKLIPRNPEKAAQEVRDIQMTSRAALKQVRELVSGMNAVSIHDEIRHARQILAAAQIGVETEGDFAGLDASPLIQNILGMCLREAVTNVVKHSKASLCRIALHEDDSGITVTVSDNGEGLRHASCPTPSSGRGLLGMKERLDLIDGKLTFQSEEGQETTVTFTVPKIVKHQKSGENAQ